MFGKMRIPRGVVSTILSESSQALGIVRWGASACPSVRVTQLLLLLLLVASEFNCDDSESEAMRFTVRDLGLEAGCDRFARLALDCVASARGAFVTDFLLGRKLDAPEEALAGSSKIMTGAKGFGD